MKEPPPLTINEGDMQWRRVYVAKRDRRVPICVAGTQHRCFLVVSTKYVAKRTNNVFICVAVSQNRRLLLVCRQN